MQRGRRRARYRYLDRSRRNGCDCWPLWFGEKHASDLLGAIDTPTTGQVFLDGVDVATLDDYERTLFRRRRIGFVFQAFNLIPTLTALENVALPLELDGVTESRSLSGRARCWNGFRFRIGPTICPT